MIKSVNIDFDCDFADRETDTDLLKALFEELKKEFALAYIDEAYNDVIRSAIYE